MAIIRLDCNLNGGDSVTPNNELFYRIYGDVDAYASPIHETGTALSDANVTVDNDNVIITGVDGATNTTFKIAAVDGLFNEGVLSDASVESSIIFEDDFAGVVFDVAKWTVYNANPGRVLYTQNNEFIATIESLTSSGLGEDYLSKVGQLDMTTTNVVGFDVKTDAQGDTPTVLIGFSKSEFSVDRFFRIDFLLNSAENSISVNQYVNNVLGDTTTYNVDLSSYSTFKFIFDGTNYIVYNWTGTWTAVTTIAAIDTPVGDYYPYILYRTNGTNGTIGDTFNVDNYTVSSSDYSSQYPLGYTP